MPEHQHLKIAYGQIKMELAATSQNGVEFGQKKNPIIRKILQAAGWTDADINEKESLDYRVAGEEDLPYEGRLIQQARQRGVIVLEVVEAAEHNEVSNGGDRIGDGRGRGTQCSG